MESELFGHERGAFTSADAPRVGRFELADGGTILLDEVTEIPPPLQAKLLRVLQERSFERVGCSETLSVDVRVLATTNRDLHGEISAGRFRQDLYFRLAVVPLHVPPLRERKQDVPRLTDYFLAQVARRLNRPPCELDEPARELLAEYHWPGNVRELENIVTRASVLSRNATIGADQLRPWLIDPLGQCLGPQAQKTGADSIPIGWSLQQMERRLIEATLEHFEGHRGETARALGIGVRTLANKLRSYGYAPRAKVFGRAA
jgi:transcriptional regulator with GAF, ATPase, and Fis domain